MLSVKIITPLGLYETCEAEQIQCVSQLGELGLLPNHMPIIAMLKTSKLTLTVKGEKKEFAISGGILHLLDNNVKILTDAIEGKEEIDIERAEKAKERAEKRLQKRDSNTNMARAELALQRAINRISVSKG